MERAYFFRVRSDRITVCFAYWLLSTMFILTYRTIAISDRCTKTKTAKTRVVLFKIWSLLRRWRNWNWVMSARMYSNQFKPYTFDSLCSSGNPKNQRWFKSTRKVFKIHQLGFEHKIWNYDSKDEYEEILLSFPVFGYRYDTPEFENLATNLRYEIN